MNETQQEESKLTPEQIKQRKEEMLLFYKEQIPFLETQLQYETLLTSLEESRARYLRAQEIIMNITAPPPEEKSESKTRTLKKES